MKSALSASLRFPYKFGPSAAVFRRRAAGDEMAIFDD
jgi:hypothetical protein